MCLRVPPLRWALLTTATLVAINWFIYIYGVSTQQVLETSLGYFINPLFSVLLGMVFFHERPRRLQWLAIALAAAGVAGMTMVVGEFPWIALGLAGSFGIYGLFRKKTPVDGLLGLSVETFLLAPAAAAYMIWLSATNANSLGSYGATCDALILASGAVTAVPLICFGQAARRLRLSTLGFLPVSGAHLAVSVCGVCAGRTAAGESVGVFRCNLVRIGGVCRRFLAGAAGIAVLSVTKSRVVSGAASARRV